MNHIITSIRVLAFCAVLIGVYEGILTAYGKIFFSHEASGSLVESKGEVIGSMLLSQPFRSSKYFSGRIADVENALNPEEFKSRLRVSSTEYFERQVKLKNIVATRFNDKLIPIDFITSSASGLDPHISKNAAYFQIESVAKARGVSTIWIKNLVDKLVESPKLLIIGEEKVNVLKLNLELDKQFSNDNVGNK
jgi:K+-transporting ATPase ATPase C chain